MDFSQFKKIGSTSSHTIFEHPEGHTIHVSHKALGAKERNEMRSIPVKKMADGGDVEVLKEPQDEQPGFFDQLHSSFRAVDPTANSAPAEGVLAPQLEQQPQPQQDASIGQFPQLPPTVPQASASTPSDPYGTASTLEAFQKGIGEQTVGIQQGAEAQGNLGKSQTQVLNHQEQGLQHLDSEYQKHLTQLDQEGQAFLHDVQNGHIDPKHYLGDMSTGQKVATGIGLILGGIGSGLTGGENPVLKMLNSQIDRDIEAQKANLSNKHTLLSANMQQHNNLNQATMQTRIQMQDLLKVGLEKAAAQAQSPQAKANALQALGQLDQSTAQMKGQLAARQAIMSSAASGHIQPEQVIYMNVPKERQAEASKQLKDAQDRASAGQQAIKVFDDLNGQTLGGALHPGRKAALVDPIAVSMARDAAGRVNEYEMKAFQNLFPAPGDAAETRTKKRAQLGAFIQEKMHFPTLQEFGVPVPKINVAAPYPKAKMLGQ